MNTEEFNVNQYVQDRSARWFIFNEDYQLGPLTWESVMIKLESNLISDQDAVWTSGMADWQPLRTILTKTITAQPAPAPAPLQVVQPAPAQIRTHTIITKPAIKQAEQVKTKRFHFKPTKKQKIISATAILGIGIGILFFSPEKRILSQLSADLASEEFSNAKSFLQKPALLNAQAIISITKGNATTPAFHILANLKDKTLVDIQLLGIQGTLLGRPHYEKIQTLPIENRWLKTDTFLDIGNKPLARGVYTVTASNHETHEVISKRSYFIGGPRDAEFEAELKQYNVKLLRKSQAEQAELKQYVSTLENQLTETNSRFHEAIRGKGYWTAKLPEWNMFQSQLTSMLNEFTPEVIERDIYYYQLFTAVKKLEAEIRELHQKQATIVKEKTFERSKVEPVFDLESTLQSRLIDLQTRIQRINTY